MDKRLALIEELKREGIHHSDILNAIKVVPREIFVPEEVKSFAYENEPLPIGESQTISQPYIVARMTELLLGDAPLKNVLEIGTGSGYQAAILSRLVDHVYTIERILPLLARAKQCFNQLGYDNIHTLYGDGYNGWPEHAPYDGIIVTAAAPFIPEALKDQLAEGGRMIIPVEMSSGSQQLVLLVRNSGEFEIELYDPVIFVPMLHGKMQ